MISPRFSKTGAILAVALVITLLNSGKSLSDVPETDWYAVEPWEKEVCRHWGGYETAISSSNQGTLVGAPEDIAELTLTIQAQRRTYPDNSSLYEVAWYIHPFQGSVAYSVYLIGSSGQLNIITESANYLTGDSGYYSKVFSGTEKFLSARLDYDTGSLTVPVVEVG